MGNFEDGMFHGDGELRYPEGAKLRGSWKRGHMLDKTLLFADGLEYSEYDWGYCKMPDRRYTDSCTLLSNLNITRFTNTAKRIIPQCGTFSTVDQQ